MSLTRHTLLTNKRIDEKTKFIVSGYIRKCQLLLQSKNNAYYNIPLLVEHICISYYWIAEYFSKYGKGIAIKMDDSCSTLYGNIQIDHYPMIYKWTFKIIQNIDQMDIGIADWDGADGDHIDDRFTESCQSYNDPRRFYAMDERGLKISFHDRMYTRYSNHGRIDNGDLITMTLDINLSSSTLSYSINGEDQGIAFRDIEFKNKTYKMAIFMECKQDQIQLVDFKQILK